jgi:hypothetical protein
MVSRNRIQSLKLKKLPVFLGVVSFTMSLLLGISGEAWAQSRPEFTRSEIRRFAAQLNRLQQRLDFLESTRGGWVCSAQCGAYRDHRIDSRRLTATGRTLEDSFGKLSADCGGDFLFLSVEPIEGGHLRQVTAQEVCAEDPRLHFPPHASDRIQTEARPEVRESELPSLLGQLQTRVQALEGATTGFFCSAQCGSFSGNQLNSRRVFGSGVTEQEAFARMAESCGSQYLYRTAVSGDDGRTYLPEIPSYWAWHVCAPDPRRRFSAQVSEREAGRRARNGASGSHSNAEVPRGSSAGPAR